MVELTIAFLAGVGVGYVFLGLADLWHDRAVVTREFNARVGGRFETPLVGHHSSSSGMVADVHVTGVQEPPTGEALLEEVVGIIEGYPEFDADYDRARVRLTEALREQAKVPGFDIGWDGEGIYEDPLDDPLRRELESMDRPYSPPPYDGMEFTPEDAPAMAGHDPLWQDPPIGPTPERPPYDGPPLWTAEDVARIAPPIDPAPLAAPHMDPPNIGPLEAAPYDPPMSDDDAYRAALEALPTDPSI